MSKKVLLRTLEPGDVFLYFGNQYTFVENHPTEGIIAKSLAHKQIIYFSPADYVEKVRWTS